MANTAQQVLNNLRVQTQFKLSYPIVKPDGETIMELQVRRIKGRDLREFEERGFKDTDGIKMANFYILRLTGIVPEDLDEMDSKDYRALTALVESLVEEGKPQTSES